METKCPNCQQKAMVDGICGACGYGYEPLIYPNKVEDLNNIVNKESSKVGIIDVMKRHEVESLECWDQWRDKIPYIRFPSNWKVKIIPPFCGAMARFLVMGDNNEFKVSIYLDCFDRIGFYGEPYWEIYPYDEDVCRVPMNNTKQLIKKIKEALEIIDSNQC